MTEVEKALRRQREFWKKISSRVVAEHFIRALPSKSPDRILLLGEGSSLHSAKLIALSLLRAWEDQIFSKKPQICAMESIAVGVEITPRATDWVFALSHRGKTAATHSALKLCRKAGSFCILVASEEVSTHEEARFVLPTSPLEQCEPHTMGMTGAICAVTSLFWGQKGVDRWHHLAGTEGETHPGTQWNNPAHDGVPSILLGEWEGYWIAQETSLKLMEMASLRTHVWGTEAFFHGPRQHAIRNNPLETLWHVHHPSDARAAELKPQLRLTIPSDSPLAWMGILEELQWRAFFLAQHLGRNPDTGEQGPVSTA